MLATHLTRASVQLAASLESPFLGEEKVEITGEGNDMAFCTYGQLLRIWVSTLVESEALEILSKTV